jgi:hypothetical protein
MLTRTRSNSFVVKRALTRAVQFAGRSIGPGDNRNAIRRDTNGLPQVRLDHDALERLKVRLPCGTNASCQRIGSGRDRQSPQVLPSLSIRPTGRSSPAERRTSRLRFLSGPSRHGRRRGRICQSGHTATCVPAAQSLAVSLRSCMAPSIARRRGPFDRGGCRDRCAPAARVHPTDADRDVRSRLRLGDNSQRARVGQRRRNRNRMFARLDGKLGHRTRPDLTRPNTVDPEIQSPRGG